MPKSRDDLLVLCYHAVSPVWATELAIAPQQLARQLRMLESLGYRGVRFSDAVLGSTGRGRRVAVTFDDGYTSVLTLAKPLLDELGWPATLFVPTDYIGSDRPMSWPGIDDWIGGPHERELMPLAWDGVRELRDSGWEIGSHTCSHKHLTTLSDGDLRRELATAKAVCERELGGECVSIAYPYGDCDERVIAAAGRAGYRAGAALAERSHASATLHWPRVGIYLSDTDARFRRQVSRRMRVLERSPLWPLARNVVERATSRFEPAAAIDGTTPTISLVASRGVLIRGRARAAAVGLLGRLGVSAVHVMWPEASSPQLVTCPAASHTVTWMTRRFEPIERRRAARDPATWAVLRARAAFVGRGTGDAVALAEIALGRPLVDPHVAIFRASGSRWVKALAFVWDDGDDEPSVVVKRMPYPLPLEGCHLRHETEILAGLRLLLAGDPLAATLPRAPLHISDSDAGYTVVEPVDPLGGKYGAPDRARSLRWLRDLHEATGRRRPWDPSDEMALLRSTERAYEDARLGGVAALCTQLRTELAPLRGAPVPAVVEHRDFWAGNLAAADDELRVYDWEWARIDGRPFFDLWTWELADLRGSDGAGRARDVLKLRGSVRRVEEELVARGIDPAFAHLTLPSVIGEVALRGDWATGTRIMTTRSREIMQAAGQLVLEGVSGGAASRST